MAVRSTTALRKYLTQRSNLGQPLREKAGSTTGGHVEGETLITSGSYRRPLFKSSQTSEDLRHLALSAPHARTRERALALFDITQHSCATQVAVRTGRRAHTVMD